MAHSAGRCAGADPMSEKTEYPTAKKLRKAREEGQVGKSKDLTQTVLIVALFGYFIVNSKGIFKSMGEMVLLPAATLDLPFEAAVNVVVTKLVNEAILIMLPVLGIVIGLGLFIELIQTGMLFSFKAIKPSGKKLNIATNVKNIVSIKNLVEFLKSTLKIIFLSVLLTLVLRDALPMLMTLPGGGVPGLSAALGTLVTILILNVAVAYAAISAADYAWQKHQHIKGLMMSKEEVKQEYKEAEGDPYIKQMRKHLHKEMLQEAAIDSSRRATVIVTNPTHLAIAILYDQDSTPLPMVLAKGEGILAERMIQAAREAGVPVLQNIPLAHALMDGAELEQYIPSDLIEAVAQLLRLVQDMNRPSE